MLRTLLIFQLCLWLSLASPLGVLGTAVNLDSLWGVWNDKRQPDTLRLKAMHDIAWNGYADSQPDSAFYFAQMEYDFAEAIGHKKGMAAALNTQGVSLKDQGIYDQAMEYFDKSLKIAEETGNKRGMAFSYNNMALIYDIQGNYKRALGYYDKSLKIFQETGNKRGMAFSYNNIGLIYGRDGNYQQALEYYRKSLKIMQEIGDKKGKAFSCYNIGVIYYKQGNYEQALEYYDKSLKIAEETGNKKGVAINLTSIGLIYSSKGNYKLAMEYYDKSLKIYEEIGHKQGMASSYITLGEHYFDQENYTKALSLGKQALTLSQEVGAVKEIESASELLYDVYKETVHPAQALEMHELYIEMSDSLNSIENKEASIKLEYKHQYEKEQALAEAKHQEQMALSAEREKRQQLIAYSAGGGLVMVLLFAFFIFNRLQVTRRQKKVIEEQKQVVEEQKQVVEEQKQKVEEQKKDITDSIRYAENIQKALLPAEEDISLLPEGFVLFQPKDIVSGDFYWMQHHKDMVYFAACDCTGHGVPGAFMSMIGSSLLDEAVVEKGITQPNEIFFEVRKGFINALKQTEEAGTQKDGMDAVLCSWNKNGTLEYSLAYNPLLLIRKGEILETKADKQPVGFHTGAQKPFTHHELKLDKGDTVYIFSDGYPDQFGGPKDKKFMMKNFKKLLLSIQDKTMNEQKTILETTMAEWKGDTEQVDDILVMGVRF